jgi:tetratricopeptide (TPR) repeat protein
MSRTEDLAARLEQANQLLSDRDFDKMVAILEPALQSIEVPDRQKFGIRIRMMLGIAYQELNRLPDARKILELAVASAREEKIPELLARSLHELALVLAGVGDLPSAIQTCRESITLCVEPHTDRLFYVNEPALALYTLSILYSRNQEPDAATAALALAREAYEARQDLPGVGKVLNQLAVLAARAGNDQAAANYFAASARLKKMIGDGVGFDVSMRNLITIAYGSPAVFRNANIQRFLQRLK